MPIGSLLLTDSMPYSLLSGEPWRLDETDLTALLLLPTYQPDSALHTSFGDIADHEVHGADYQRQRLHGARFFKTAKGASFSTDSILFGDPICLPPVRYLAICAGLPTTLDMSARLVGTLDLAPDGVAVEAVRGRFAVNPPADGWFTLTQVS